MKNLNTIDEKYMRRAIQLARFGGVSVAPNPKVGAVIVFEDKIIGEGYHKKYGQAHAEVNAVNAVEDKNLLSKSTLYVTLEPCVHYGKTPPCADLIIRHEFKKVVIGSTDPNPKITGKGIEKLKASGIEVVVDVLRKETDYLNRRFFTFYQEKRPYIILKWAETRDGFIDRLSDKRSDGVNWITNSGLKLWVHKWRSEEQAIMVGWKTIKNDNPQLNVREIDGISPHRFIIDPGGNTPANATVFQDGKPTSLITTKNMIDKLPEHVEIITLNNFSTQNILAALYERNILSVFIEGGAATLQKFIDEKLWDEAYKLIGNTVFNKGIEAPQLRDKILIDTNFFDKDIVIKYMKRK